MHPLLYAEQVAKLMSAKQVEEWKRNFLVSLAATCSFSRLLA